MPDIADKAQDEYEIHLESAVEAARAAPGDLSGPAHCIKCQEANDRARAGFCVCSDCVESQQLSTTKQV